MPTATDNLRQLRRAIARLAHPDLARTDEDRTRFTVVMTRANAAFANGNTADLESILVELRGDKTKDAPTRREPRKTRARRAPNSSSTNQEEQAKPFTAKEASAKAKMVGNLCRATLPHANSSNAFLQAILDYMDYAITDKEYAKVERLASDIHGLLARWKASNGDGRKMITAFTAIYGALSSFNRSDRHSPFGSLYRAAIAAFVALDLSTLQDLVEKVNTAVQNHEAYHAKLEATRMLFKEFRGDQDKIKQIQQIISQSPIINLRNGDGDTPLHMAARAGCHREIIQLLALAGADVNAHNAAGETPLHVAIRNGEMSVALTLLDYGADASIPTTSGLHPKSLFELVRGTFELLRQRLGSPKT